MKTFVDSLFGRDSTVRVYSSLWRTHIEPHVSPDEAREFTQQDLNALGQIWANKKLAKPTYRQLAGLLKMYIRWAGGDPTKISTKIILKKLGRLEQESERKCLTMEEASKLLALAKQGKKRTYLFILLGLHAGLRRGEILGLQYADIDALSNKITIQRSYHGNPTKNGKSRSIPISEDLAEALEDLDYLQKNTEEYLFEKMMWNPNIQLAALCEKAGIPSITSHGLRHTFATLALESGVSPRTVQSWLGHTNLATTLNTYSSIMPNETRMDFLPRLKLDNSK
jgi:integrase